MKKRILFVDDEPNVLHGLKRMFHGMRHEWEMTFVESGAAGLEAMSGQAFNVVVTDMRMPEMNGVQFLTEVKKRHPETVRIVLSGHSDTKLILDSVRVAHQYISKPVDSEELKGKVNRACTLLDLLNKAPLLRLVSNMGSIPTLPFLFMEITRELEQEEPSMEKIGGMISRDPAMTAKILQLVNSSFFSIPRHVTSPAQAVSLLGLDTVKSLVLTVEIFSKFDMHKLQVFNIEELWDHSFRTGKIAREIARSEELDRKRIDDACIAGLLHDVGKLILMDNLFDEYHQAFRLSRDRRISIHDAENEIFGVSHAEIGAYLLGIWGLPYTIVETIAFHHAPNQFPLKTIGPLLAVHAADILAKVDDGEMDVKALFLPELGIDGRISAWNDIRREVLAMENKDDI